MNKIKTIINAIIIIVLFTSILITNLTSSDNHIWNRKIVPNYQSHSASTVIKNRPAIIQNKNFLYMYNVATCLPLYLLTDQSLGKATNRDILVLSYASRCLRNDPQHVNYIFTGNKTTWGEGRNILYW